MFFEVRGLVFAPADLSAAKIGRGRGSRFWVLRFYTNAEYPDHLGLGIRVATLRFRTNHRDNLHHRDFL